MPGKHQDIPVNVKLLAGTAKLQQALQAVIDLREDRDDLALALHGLLTVVEFQIDSFTWKHSHMVAVEIAREVSKRERKPPCVKEST